MSTSISRRRVLQSITASGIGTLAFGRALAVQVAGQGDVTAEMVQQAEWISGITLDDDQREEVARAVAGDLSDAAQLRQVPVDVDTVPALVFRPDFFYDAVERDDQKQNASTGDHQTRRQTDIQVLWSPSKIAAPLDDEQLAFASLSEQASWLAAEHITSLQLTKLYLQRLEKYDPLLKCVVTLLADHALDEATASDARRRDGKTLGILDGIPWLAKDLIAVPPYKTTWGGEPFVSQVREPLATVAEKLRDCGAVLLAKVSLGTMAWGDKWFGGTTRNPWNPIQGSSGSSAGSAAGVAAGLATFALGSETLGSIVSPTRRCRTCGLRGTFGSVSRAGCMPLAWSMDKIGPIARHVDDLAHVFAALLGTDGKDPTLVQRGFQWPQNLAESSLRVGVTGDRLSAIEQQALDTLVASGATPVEVDLSSSIPVDAMNFILGVEASTVFDDVFRLDQDADYGLWPKTFRSTQFIPAIEYLRANRLRGQLITETEQKLRSVDVVLGGNDLLLTNLTGHPCIVVACGADQVRDMQMPGVVKLTAAAYQESKLLQVAGLLQARMPPEPARPPLDSLLAEF